MNKVDFKSNNSKKCCLVLILIVDFSVSYVTFLLFKRKKISKTLPGASI